MATCEPFREQLLDFVYGLCDETEAQALRAHLEVCSSCQDFLTRAQGQRTLIGRAALAVGADEVPVFHRPAAAAPALHEELPSALPLAAPAPRRRAPVYRRWVACAAAAAVVLGVGTLWYLHGAGRRPLEQAIAQNKATLDDVDAQLARFEPGFAAEAAEVDRKLRAEAPLHLYVMSPTQLSARGGEVVQFATRDLGGQPIAAKVTLTIQDADGNQVLSRHEAVTVGGAASVSLGDDLATVLQERASVQLVAEAAAGKATARVQETLKVAAPAYVAHLVTNKTVFRPGELLFFRAVVLDRAGLTPPAGPIALRFSLVDAVGHTIGFAQAQAGPGGIAAGELAVTDKWADGNYELRVAAEQPGMSNVRPHTRKLQIARDANFDVQADRDLYKAGETVNMVVPRMVTQVPQAKPKATSGPMNADVFVDGQKLPLLNAFPANTAQGQAQGQPLPGAFQYGQNFGGGFGGGGNARLGRADQTQLQFNLPKELDTNRVRVKIVLNDAQNGKAQETFEQDIAVVPSRIAIDFFPEGGDLIAGVPNRVCYRVRSPRGEPVNPEGRVIVLSGSDVLFDSAPGEGTGSFTFTPRVGDAYVARITTPGGSTMEFADPFARQGGVRAEGLVLHASKPVTAEGDAFEVVLRNPGTPKRVLLVAQCGGRLVAQQWVEAKGTDTPVALGTLSGARGLVRLTAYESDAGALKPMAERLVYRAPVARLDLSALHLGGVIANQGQKSVQLALRARDQNGEPIPTWVLAAVIDERFRTREPNLLAHFFLAGDIRGGEDLDNAALLAADTPEARQALDLFLGTAGWRRFETAPNKVAAPAALAEAGFVGVENASPRVLQAQHEARVEEALTPVRLAVQAQHTSLTSSRLSAQAALNRAVSELRDYEAQPQEYLRVGLGAVTLLLLGIAVAMMAVGAWRLVRRRQATLLFAGTFACLGLCLVSMFMLSSLGPPTESMPGPLADLPGARFRLLDGLNFHPRFGAAADGALVGQFAAAAAPRRAGTEVRPDAEGAAVDRKANNLAELPEAKNFFLANEYRGLGLKDSPAKGAAAHALPLDLAERFKKADQDNIKALDFLGKAEGQSGALAGGPAAPVGGNQSNRFGSGFPAGAAIETQLRSEQAKRVFVYQHLPGLEHDTLLWYPALFLTKGSAQVAFDVPGAAGAYRVLLLGHTADGRLGCYEGRLEVQPEPGR